MPSNEFWHGSFTLRIEGVDFLILTFVFSHDIINSIVTVFSLENKVSVLQSVKWRRCAVWHFFCFLPAKRVEIYYFAAGKTCRKGSNHDKNDHHRRRRVQGI